MKRLPAFTLSEMLVVLLLTTVVVGLAYSVLQLVQRQMLGIGNNLGTRTEWNRMRQALWVDMHAHNRAVISETDGLLWFTHEADTLTYEFAQTWVRREQDTFHLRAAAIQGYFASLPQEQGPVDALEVSNGREARITELFVFRRNDAAVQMNE